MVKKDAVLSGQQKVSKGWEKGKDSRLALGALLADDIRNAVSARSVRHERWEQLESLYFDRAPARPYEPYEGAADSHIPIVQPKVDALGSLVVGTIFSSDVPCRAVPYVSLDEQSIVARKEQIVWSVLKEAGFRQALDKLSPIAGYTNCAHLFAYWDKGKSKLSLEVARPQEVAAWPCANIERPQDAKLLMRQRWLRYAQVQELQRQPGWFSDKELSEAGDPTTDGTAGSTFRVAHTDGKMTTLDEDWELTSSQKPRHPATRRSDYLVELYEGVFHAPGDAGEETLYWGVVDFKAEALLYVERVADLTHGCFKFGYKPETGFGYYDRSSVADNLQEIQLYANELLSLTIDGVRFSTFGTVFGSSYTGTSADMRTEPGQIVLGLVLEPQGMMIPRPDLTWTLPTLQYLINYADIVARVSAETTGGQPKKNTTATEIQARLAGQAAGVEAYIRKFGQAVRDVFKHVEEILVNNFEQFAGSDLGVSLGVTPDDMAVLQLPCSWELAAESPEATPTAHLQFLQNGVMPLLGVPGNGVDTYALMGRVLEYGRRLGGFDPTGLQTSKDPQVQVLDLAKTLGVEPQLLMGHVQEAMNEAAGTAGMGEGMEEGAGGMGVPAGVPDQPTGLDGVFGGMAGADSAPPGLLEDSQLLAGLQ